MPASCLDFRAVLTSNSWCQTARRNSCLKFISTSCVRSQHYSAQPCVYTSRHFQPIHSPSLRLQHKHSKWRCHAEADSGQPQQRPALAVTATDNAEILANTKRLVETAMLAAVSGLAYVVATTAKMENSLGYFMPLPVIIGAMRSGPWSGFRTAFATSCLLLVLLGPIRAVAYLCLHGMLAATLGALWYHRLPWSVTVPAGALVRMAGQLTYLMLTCFTMNENVFLVLLNDVHSLLDNLSAAMGTAGAPSPTAIVCVIFSLMLVNGLTYTLLLHILYHIALANMGFKLGPIPGFIKSYLYAGMVDQQEAKPKPAS